MKITGNISPDEAVEIAAEYGVSVTAETIRSWCNHHKIGRKIVGRYRINKRRLIWLLEGREWQTTNEEKKNQ